MSKQNKIDIQAVIFDYGNVLSHPQSDSDVTTMAEQCAMPVERFHALYWKFRPAYDRGELDGTSFWTSVFAQEGRTPTAGQISELLSQDIQSWLHINEATMRWVEQLRSSGTPLALLSNMPLEIARHIENSSPWASYFNPLTFSCDLGSIKPEPGIYRNCLERLDVPPEKVLFLDDRAENVAAATQLGMRSLIFDDMEKVASKVQRLFNIPVPIELGIKCHA